MIRILALILIGLCAAAAAHAQPVQVRPVPAEAGRMPTTDVGASLTVAPRGISVSTVRPMRLEAERTSAIGSVQGVSRDDAPALIRVGGDPGRVYRIRLPQTLATGERLPIGDLNIWSENAGDVSETRAARMDADGRDMLRVTGRLRPGVNGEAVIALPLSIDYE